MVQLTLGRSQENFPTSNGRIVPGLTSPERLADSSRCLGKFENPTLQISTQRGSTTDGHWQKSHLSWATWSARMVLPPGFPGFRRTERTKKPVLCVPANTAKSQLGERLRISAGRATPQCQLPKTTAANGRSESVKPCPFQCLFCLID